MLTGALSYTKDYTGGFVYTNNLLDFFNTQEGRVVNNDGLYENQYFLKDHLGNVRAAVAGDAAGLVHKQVNQYYPFGLELANIGMTTDNDNKFKYNAKELEDDHNLYWYHYGARYYDPQLGRWHNIDPSDENYSPFVYVFNNPLLLIDPTGEDSWVYYDPAAFSNQAKSEADNLNNLYKTDVHLVEITSVEKLTESWNDMANSGLDIDEVSIMMHGDHEGIYINSKFRQNGKLDGIVIEPRERNYLSLNKLSNIDIPKINLLTCDGAGIGQFFADKFNATVNAWEGGLSFHSISFTNTYMSGPAGSQRIRFSYGPRSSSWLYQLNYYSKYEDGWEPGPVTFTPTED